MLSSIPTEVLTGLASAGLTAWMKLKAQQSDLERMRAETELRRLGAVDASRAAAGTRGGEWTRRILALLAANYLFVLVPLGGAMLLPGAVGGVTLVYEQTTGGLWGWMSGSAPRMYSSGAVFGILITPVQTHLASMVYGFYFGAGIVKRK